MRDPGYSPSRLTLALWKARGRYEAWQFDRWYHCRFGTPDTSPPAVADLRDDYEYYVRHVSDPAMPVSWEFVIALVNLLDAGGFASCLDLGSGFTSYVTRWWCVQTGRDMRCISVDDDSRWLAATGAFLRSKSMPASDLLTEEAAGGLDVGAGVDFIIYDYSGFEKRSAFLVELPRLAHRDTIFLFDDCQPRPDKPYRRDLDRWCAASGVDLLSLEDITRDHFGRYAALGHFRASDAYRRLVGRLSRAAGQGRARSRGPFSTTARQG